MRELLRAAFVIARRDFSATVLSRAFLLFLLGPFFPVLMILIFGAATAPMSDAERPTVAVIAKAPEYQALEQARWRLNDAVGAPLLVNLRHVPPTGDPQQPSQVLRSKKPAYVAVLYGGLDNPRLLGSVGATSGTAKQIRLFIAEARRSSAASGPVNLPVLRTQHAPTAPAGAQALTARGGQSLLFLLTLLLAGMLLSQLIEEKSNKVIEVLAAAVPVDSIFLGKLLAMLTASLVGIAVWTSVGAAVIAAVSSNGINNLPVPAVGWPAFMLLGLVYFAMSYLLLGAIFLGIGAHASSAREVQTLSMPVTMAQVVIFALASIAVGQPDSSKALAAAVFPLSSPYVMIARAAEMPGLIPHLVAVAWQLLWVAVFLRVASGIFRKSVLKSGPVRSKQRKAARV
jgi:ABC-2 type transport system permease protein